MSASNLSQRVFISYRSQDPDRTLAQIFYDQIKASGHQPFMAGESIQIGEDWAERIDAELKQCDYFLLLISPLSATSDMVLGELRTVQRLRHQHPAGKPLILPIRVNLPIDDPLNYELRSFLQPIQQRIWNSEADTQSILTELLAIFAKGEVIPVVEAEIAEAEPVTTVAIETLARPPLPVAELELPGGVMELASQFYIKREPWELRCYQEIKKRAGLIRIKAPRQMGKTSLLARITHHAEQQGYRIVSLTFQETDESVFQDLNRFLKRFCALVSRKLGVSPKLINDYWDDELFGPMENCEEYFAQGLLADLTVPLVLGLDEVERIFAYPQVAKEFLALLRAWNEKAKINSVWGKLRLVLVHSTEAYVVMDTNSSPFNIGLPVELREFNPEQVAELVQRHRLNWHPGEIEQLMELVGGHPFLVREALYHIAQQDFTLAQFLTNAPTDAGVYGDHLRRHLWNLQQHPDLMAGFKQVVMTSRQICLDPTLAFKLNGMGLVNLEGNYVTLRHAPLYRPYFQERLRVSR